MSNNNKSGNKFWVRVMCLALAALMILSVGYVLIDMLLV